MIIKMDLALNTRNKAKAWNRGFFENVLGVINEADYTTKVVENGMGQKIEYRYRKVDEENLQYYLESYKGKARVSDSQIRAVEKWKKENYEFYNLRLNKGEKAILKAKADAEGKSMNQYIREALFGTDD